MENLFYILMSWIITIAVIGIAVYTIIKLIYSIVDHHKKKKNQTPSETPVDNNPEDVDKRD